MNNYEQYKNLLSKIADINNSIAVLSWDNEVYMPQDGASFRSQQIATLSGMAHEMFTHESFGESLQKLMEDKNLDRIQQRNVKLSWKTYNKSKKLTEDFVIKKSKAISKAYQSWVKARTENDWTIFAGNLENLVKITQEESALYNEGDHLYDSLLDLYEPDMTVSKLDILFQDVKDSLFPLIQKIRSQSQVEDKFLFQEMDTDKQWNYGLEILKKMGYDFNKGRQDISEHPFTTSFSPQDVRVTTRLKKDDFPMMLWSCIHEGGHALYEQGLPIDQYGLPSGSAISLGIHESQSRLWENNVGRSKSYWKHHFPELQSTFAKQFDGISLDQFYKAINRINPNLIRTEGDELHYHFHVMIRYEIEKDLIQGNISVNDLQDIWNDTYEKYLGLRPKDDKTGILQDIHWSHGSFGYFPTYSLGSFYAAQFFEQATYDIDSLNTQIEKGNTTELLNWLRENIHQYGHSYEAEELCEKITGRKLELASFLKYAESKYMDVYSIS